MALIIIGGRHGLTAVVSLSRTLPTFIDNVHKGTSPYLLLNNVKLILKSTFQHARKCACGWATGAVFFGAHARGMQHIFPIEIVKHHNMLPKVFILF